MTVVAFEDVEGLNETASGLWVAGLADADVFVPFRVLAPESEVRATGDVGTLVVQDWWARERGLSA